VKVGTLLEVQSAPEYSIPSLSLYDLLPGDAAGDTDPTAVAGDALT
jgi:hypothetical protein